MAQNYTDLGSICTATTCSIPAPTALADGRHTFWVIASKSAGWGAWSNGQEYCVTVCVVSPPGKPTATGPTGTVSTNPPTFAWYRLGGPVSGYAVYDLAPNGQYDVSQTYPMSSTLCSASTCSVAAPSALASGKHTVFLIAWNVAGWGAWSDGLTYTIP